jgi:hypothetical protein
MRCQSWIGFWQWMWWPEAGAELGQSVIKSQVHRQEQENRSKYTKEYRHAYPVFDSVCFQCSWNACQQHAEDCGFKTGLHLFRTQIRTGMYWYVVVCTSMYWYVLVCTGMYWYVLVCIFMYCCIMGKSMNILVWTCMFWYMLLYTGIYWDILVCTVLNDTAMPC